MTTEATIRIGTVARLPLRVHASWVVALFFVTSSLAVSLAPVGGRLAPVAGAVTATAVFASLVAHELGHSLVARRVGIDVSAITLFAFGGVASLEGEPQRPRDEIAIALAGPIVSAMIAAASFAVSLVLPLPPLVIESLQSLARANAGIALFNLLPGFPLDGGRIVRGIVWAASGDACRATIAAAASGRVSGWALIGLGVISTLLGRPGDGLWLSLVGWFVLDAARAAVTSLETSSPGIAA